jgi:hypothetical protein
LAVVVAFPLFLPCSFAEKGKGSVGVHDEATMAFLWFRVYGACHVIPVQGSLEAKEI